MRQVAVVGLYDTVHGGDRCGQTKALGKGLRDFVPGDRAQIIPAPMSDEDMELFLSPGGIQPVADSGNVAFGSVRRWAILRSGVVVGWSEEGDPELPWFSYLGQRLDERPVTDQLARRRDQRADEPGDCEPCRAVREGRAAAWRAAQPRRPVWLE